MFTAGWIVVTRNNLAVIIHNCDRSLTQTWAVFFSFRHFLQNQDNVDLLSRKLATIFFSTQIFNFDSTKVSYSTVSNLNFCLPSVFFKGGGGILLFSYKVVDFFVDIIYESTLGGYEKVLGISRPEKKKIWILTPPALHRGDWFWGYFPLFLSNFL